MIQSIIWFWVNFSSTTSGLSCTHSAVLLYLRPASLSLFPLWVTVRLMSRRERRERQQHNGGVKSGRVCGKDGAWREQFNVRHKTHGQRASGTGRVAVVGRGGGWGGQRSGDKAGCGKGWRCGAGEGGRVWVNTNDALVKYATECLLL